MRYAITVLLGNTKTFHKAYYIAARNGGGLKSKSHHLASPFDYIAARSGGGLKLAPISSRRVSDYIAARNGGGLKHHLGKKIYGVYYIAAGNGGGLKLMSEIVIILPPGTAGDERRKII